MKFTTQSKSVYEVNDTKTTIRRLNGTADPTPRQGKDGEWKPCKTVRIISLGEPAIIVWPDNIPALEEEEGVIMKTTITSPVLSIEENA